MNQTIQRGRQQSIFIEGKMYENLKQLNCQGTQSINYIANIFGKQNEQFIIKEYNQISYDELGLVKQIQRQQNEIQPQCQHIVKIFGIQEQIISKEQRKFLIVMEKGKDNTSKLINSNPSLSSIQRLKIFEQMVQGVIELHDLGYFHRDLKPENFVYFENTDKNYVVKLIDFGLVKQDSAVRNTGQIGTFNYMAPEVVIPEGEYDKTADIWSLGIILYELLTSQDFLQVKDSKKLIQYMQNLDQGLINKKIKEVNSQGQQEKELIQLMLQKESKKRIELKLLLQKIDQYIQTVKEQEENNILELKQFQQSFNIQSEQVQNTIIMLIQNLTNQLTIINEINAEDELKQQLLTYINDQLNKYQDKILKNEQRLQFIQQAQTKEMLKGYDSEISQECQQYMQDYYLIMGNIMKQQMQLEQQNFQIQKKEQQLKIEQEQQLKIEQEQKLKIEQEQKLKKEKVEYQSLLTIIKQQSCLQYPQIQTFQEQIHFFQGIIQQIQGKEKVQNVIKQYQEITQNIQGLEQQEKIILQFNQLQHLSLYQQFNRKLEEIQYAQNRLKIQIEEANKSIQQIDRQYLDIYYQQIENLNNQLNNFMDTFKYYSQYQKYANTINQIINDIGVIFTYLSSLKQLILQRTWTGYQQYNQTYNYINQKLREFYEYYQQLHQQINNDQQICNLNGERIKGLQIIQQKFVQFIEKMDQLKVQIKKQYCNNEQTMNKLKINLQKMDQTIVEQKKQLQSFDQFNELNSYEAINNQIQQQKEFDRKLKDIETNEIEQVNQFNLIIITEKKNEQEKKILISINQLKDKKIQFSKDLQKINQILENIKFYKQINQQKERLQEQLKNEITTLKYYLEVKEQNEQLFNEILQDNQKRKEDKSNQIILDHLKNQQYNNQQKGSRLENVFSRVSEKELEINFSSIDINIIKNCEDLTMQEEELSKKLNDINEKISNQQLNELEEYILKVESEINKLMLKIPQNNDIEEFKIVYQKNLESYETLFVLINYIKQYHLTRYYERIKENAYQQQKKKNKIENENDYKKQYQSKLITIQEDYIKSEKEAQDILQKYENILFKNYNKISIEVLEQEKKQIEKQIEIIENQIKQKNLVKLRSKLKDSQVIKEIIEQYYKITEFAYMLIFQRISRLIYSQNQQKQINQY